MYTAYGNRKRTEFLRAANAANEVAVALTPVIEKIPVIVAERVQARGVGGNGNRFSDYNSVYASNRTGKGLQVGHKDFTVSGAMWRSYKIIDVQQTNTGIVFILSSEGVTGSNGQELVDIHSAPRRKHAKGGTQGEGQNILALTKEEEEELHKDISEVIHTELNGIFGV